MPRTLYFVSHPNVAIDPAIPVPAWPLSETGRARMKAGLTQPWISEIKSIHCSNERKAIDTAMILGEHLSLPISKHVDLGENDRTATGFLPAPEFEIVATEFFTRPNESVRGWERALDAQRRILRAIQAIAAAEQGAGAIAIISHGAVGTLLHCALAGNPISRRWDQPANGGGNYYAFELEPSRVLGWWSPIDARED
jgi:broad specificity phosphatase PhoE